MIGRILFLSAAAFMAYRYIRRSNKKVEQLTGPPAGTVDILPPETKALPPAEPAAESARPARKTPRQSAAAEDLSRR